MKKYAVVDRFDGQEIQDIFNSELQAWCYASQLWGAYTEKEKQSRTAFMVVHGEQNEDIYLDTNNAKIIEKFV